MTLLNKCKICVIIATRWAIPRRLRQALFHWVFNIERDEFALFAYQYAYAPMMKHGLESLKDRGISPASIVDVGAYKGMWSRMARKVWPDARLVLIEPQIECRECLEQVARQLGAEFHPELLGAADGEQVEFTVMRSGSSVFAEQSDVPRRVEQRTLRSLDDLFQHPASVHFLKIDAEGYELEILRGATRCLDSIQVVLLEVSLIATNAGAPLMHNVIAYMYERGFVVYDVVEFHRRPLDRALNKIDLVFVPATSRLRADKHHSTRSGADDGLC